MKIAATPIHPRTFDRAATTRATVREQMIMSKRRNLCVRLCSKVVVQSG
jgi:hypothetical protein